MKVNIVPLKVTKECLIGTPIYGTEYIYLAIDKHEYYYFYSDIPKYEAYMDRWDGNYRENAFEEVDNQLHKTLNFDPTSTVFKCEWI